MRFVRNQSGQAAIEFAIIGLILFSMTVGLVDVGRGFYAYIQMASAAQFAARWASVQGGTCGDSSTPSETTADWCNALGSQTSTAFWAQPGNVPKQGSAPCPTAYDSSTLADNTYYYKVSTVGSTTYSTTVVGALAARLDTSSSSSNQTIGNWLAALDKSRFRMCIEISSDAYNSSRVPAWQPVQGDWVTVYVYYPFRPAGGILGKALQMNLVASSRYMVE